MALPKYRKSKSRTKRRRTIADKITLKNLSLCPECKTFKMPHRICPECGYYKGKKVLKNK